MRLSEGYNRTYVELKHHQQRDCEDIGRSYNRTYVELKLGYSASIIFFIVL